MKICGGVRIVQNRSELVEMSKSMPSMPLIAGLQSQNRQNKNTTALQTGEDNDIRICRQI